MALGFFLQVKACADCNRRKSALEDDISIITMLPDTAGRQARDDSRLLRTVARKAKGAVSPATRRLAAESYNRIKMRIPIPGASVTYDGLAMPTLDDQRVARLAYYHVQAFRFFATFNHELQHGDWMNENHFLMLGQLTTSDWGNPRIVHFAAAIADWEPLCVTIQADEYFKHVLRKMPGSGLWAWALEWNARLRIFGLYGDTAKSEEFARSLPVTEPLLAHGDTDDGFALFVEVPLAEEDDVLFALPSDFSQRAFAAPHWRSPKA